MGPSLSFLSFYASRTPAFRMVFVVRLFVICCLVGFCVAKIIDVEGYGRIKGTTGVSFYNKRRYYAFYRLHYAQAPLGDLRFQPPEPIGELDLNGTDAWDATFYGPVCPQGGVYKKPTFDEPNPIVGDYQGDEDCLLLNVYTPHLPTNESHPNLPVMFFIHGGAFALGGTKIYTPFKFMDEDVVLVVIQYRLGPLGFLSLQTDEVPGNAGLFDQLEALKWVKNHIYDFGGDPNRITIFGESAGGASVSLMMLSPEANGLFIGAIAESGSAIAEWAIDRDPVTHSNTVADYAGCLYPDDYSKTVNCLRTIPAQDLTGAFNVYSADDMLHGGLGFGGSSPVIQEAGIRKYINKDPVEMLEKGEYNTSIPAIFGANRDEGSFVLGLVYESYLEPAGLLNDSYYLQEELVPTLLNSLGVRDPTTTLSDILVQKYLAGEDTTNFTSMIPGLTDMLGVLYIKASGFRTAELHASHSSQSYWYSFDFQGRYSDYIYLFLGDVPPIPHGVTHTDELQYLFTFPTIFNATERELSKRMIKIWTHFATYGNPTPEGQDWLGVPKWEPYSYSQPVYMSMNTEFTMGANYEDTYTVSAEGSRAGQETTTMEPVTSTTPTTTSTSAPTTASTIPIITTTPNPDEYVDMATYNALQKQKDNLVIGTSIASVAAGVLLLALIGLVMRGKSLGYPLV